MAKTQNHYLDPNTLAAVGGLELRARMVVEGMMTGMHKSPYFGYSVEFAQHRQYAPGDDLRHLDWKVYGRSDKLYLKQYQKETNLDLVLLVDVSGSMAFGSDDAVRSSENKKSSAKKTPWRKYDYAATLASVMAHLALKQQDRVGLVMFADDARNATRTSNSHGHWRTVVDMLSNEEVDPIETDTSGLGGGRADDKSANETEARATSLARMFDQVAARLSQRSLLVLISDLFDDTEALEKGLARVKYRRHDMIVMQVLDHAELTFPFRSPSEFLGMEGEGRLPLDPEALRKAYLEVLVEHLDAVRETTRRFGFDYLKVDTSESLGPVLSHFLARRAAMVGKGR